MFCKRGVNFAKITGKHLCQSLFFNKVPGLFIEQLQWLLYWEIREGVYLRNIIMHLEEKERKLNSHLWHVSILAWKCSCYSVFFFSLILYWYKSSHRRCSVKKSVLKNFLCQSLYLKKVADLRPATLLKKETLAQVFSSQFYEIFNIFLQNTFGRLLLLIFGKSIHLTHSYQRSLSIPPEIIKNQLGFLIFTGGMGRDQ